MPARLELVKLLGRKCTCTHLTCLQQFQDVAADVQQERSRFDALDVDRKDFR